MILRHGLRAFIAGAALHKASILVFARVPQPGRVKTRLIPALGAAGAARLYCAMARHCIATAANALPGAVQLWCTPTCVDAFLATAQSTWNLTLHLQGEGDIGARMAAAFQSAFAKAELELIAGTDVPAITVADINAAVAALREGHDAVFVPVADGGYGLIGLRRFDVRLFEGIAWSTSQVMAQTRARLGELGWTWHELPARWDVDEPADLDRLRADAALSHLLRDVA